MAGNEVYIGNLFQSLIDEVQSQVSKMDDQITELGNIKTAISQNVVSLQVKSGTDKTVNLNNPDKTCTPAGAFASLLSFKSNASGMVNLQMSLTASTGTGAVNFAVSYNGGVNWLPLTYTMTGLNGTPQTFNTDIPVEPGVVLVGIKYSAGTFASSANTGIIKYSLNDIVNDQTFIKV
jgi:hypothetical protein